MSTIRPSDLPEYLTLREAAFFCAGKWPEGENAPLPNGAGYFLNKFNEYLFGIPLHIMSAMSNGTLTQEKIISMMCQYGEIALAMVQYFFPSEEAPPKGVKIWRPRYPKDVMGFMTYCSLPKSIVEDFLRRNGIRSGVFFPERVATASGKGDTKERVKPEHKSPIPDFIASAEGAIKAKTQSLINAPLRTASFSAPKILNNREMQALISSLRDQLKPMLDVRGLSQDANQRLGNDKIKRWINAELKTRNHKPKAGRPPKERVKK